MSKKGLCLLCLNEGKLIKQSHIIPCFMYSGLVDQENRMFAESWDGRKGKGSIVQTGVFDRYVLCESCDNVLLSKLEGYARGIIYGSRLLTIRELRSPDGIRSILISGIEYGKFKLFLLSILWRAHISKQPIFRHVNLREKAEVFRQIIINGIIPPDHLFKVSIIALKLNEHELIRMVANPCIVENSKANFICFMINGYMYMFNLQKNDSVTVFSKSYLKEDGTLEMPILYPPHSEELLRSYFGINSFQK